MSLRIKLITSLVILCLLVAIAILGSGVLRQSRLSDSSREFVIEVVPLLLSGKPRYEAEEDVENASETIEPPTIAETFERLAHPMLLQQQSIDDISKYLSIVTLNLGRLEVVRNIRGSSNSALINFGDQVADASYQLEVEFAGGTAEVEIDLLLAQGEWLISAFAVESNLLAD